MNKFDSLKLFLLLLFKLIHLSFFFCFIKTSTRIFNNDMTFKLIFNGKRIKCFLLIKYVPHIIVVGFGVVVSTRWKHRESFAASSLTFPKNGLSLIFLVIRNVTGIRRGLKILFIDKFPPISSSKKIHESEIITRWKSHL